MRWFFSLPTLLITGFLSISAAGAISNWPQFLGPTRDGVYQGPALSSTWPKEGPQKLWQRPVGQGFSGPVIVQNDVLIHHREGNEDIVERLDGSTGRARWNFRYPTQYNDDFGFDEGPRATPAVFDDQVFTMGAEGLVHCLSFQTGQKTWSVDCKAQYSAGKGFFGMVCSPLVEGPDVVFNIGGSGGAGIVALDRKTGHLHWKATSYEASYSSPIAATVSGKREIFTFTRNGLVILDSNSGTVLSEFPWRSRSSASVNAATPLLNGSELLLTASYDTGAILLNVAANPPTKIWSGENILSAHYATPVLSDGFLYGFDGRQEQRPAFVCVEWKTGKPKWRQENFGAGTVTLAGKNLLILNEDGQLTMAPATPTGYKPSQTAQILGRGVRPYPALADGKFVARSKDKLACFDLKPK